MLTSRKSGVLPLLPHMPTWRRQGSFIIIIIIIIDTPKIKHNEKKFGIQILCPLKQETEVYLGQLGPLEKFIYIRRHTDYPFGAGIIFFKF